MTKNKLKVKPKKDIKANNKNMYKIKETYNSIELIKPADTSNVVINLSQHLKAFILNSFILTYKLIYDFPRLLISLSPPLKYKLYKRSLLLCIIYTLASYTKELLKYRLPIKYSALFPEATLVASFILSIFTLMSKRSYTTFLLEREMYEENWDTEVEEETVDYEAREEEANNFEETDFDTNILDQLSEEYSKGEASSIDTIVTSDDFLNFTLNTSMSTTPKESNPLNIFNMPDAPNIEPELFATAQDISCKSEPLINTFDDDWVDTEQDLNIPSIEKTASMKLKSKTSKSRIDIKPKKRKLIEKLTPETTMEFTESSSEELIPEEYTPEGLDSTFLFATDLFQDIQNTSIVVENDMTGKTDTENSQLDDILKRYKK